MEYPESDAVHRDGNLSVVRTSAGHYCGYCRLPTLVAESGYDGLLHYAPVHGGITYAAESENGQMVYGFNCAHAGDEGAWQWRDRRVLLAEARNMSTAIWIASFFEPFYLLPLGNKWKAHVIDAYHQICRWSGVDVDSVQLGLGSMLAILGGDL